MYDFANKVGIYCFYFEGVAEQSYGIEVASLVPDASTSHSGMLPTHFILRLYFTVLGQVPDPTLTCYWYLEVQSKHVVMDAFLITLF